MTVPERDWDAEFDEITRHLENTDQQRISGHGATRHTFAVTDAADVEAPASSPPDAVPGFREEWRLADQTQSAPGMPSSRPAGADGAPGGDEHSAGASHDDDAEFVEPDPTPIDVDDPATVIMVGALLLGPLWLLYLLFFDRDAAWIWWSLATLVLVAGFVLAIARQPRSRSDDDDGAQV